jgi:hypothetical protein
MEITKGLEFGYARIILESYFVTFAYSTAIFVAYVMPTFLCVLKFVI